MKYIRSKAPLRIGLAGGGTDVSPFADLHGGAILNGTINLYARSTIVPNDSGQIRIVSLDLNEEVSYASDMELPLDGKLDLLKAVYNRIVRDYVKRPLSFELTTEVDVPKGSGLGSSSTITVSLIGAFMEWLQLPLGLYDIARLAYEIERVDLGMAGGRQDQYAATFGGINFMEFYADEIVVVNPLRIKESYNDELEMNLLLYYTGQSRDSSDIIMKQRAHFKDDQDDAVQAAVELKYQAASMKDALLRGDIDQIGDILDQGWHTKKRMARGITNPGIDDMYQTALDAGMTGGKISGAGGGGFMVMYCPLNRRYDVVEAMRNFDGRFLPFEFTSKGLTTWSV